MDFSKEFYDLISKNRPDFRVRGLLTSGDVVYPLGNDTKVLSTVFELIARPFVYQVARENGYSVREAPVQNFYPDFTLMRSEDDTAKLAVDVKTTYRAFRPDGSWIAKFTLGGYTSFLINETKNIVFPYSQYEKHYIIGFIYTRSIPGEATHLATVADREEIPCPIEDVDFFVQEKYRIAGERAGSGNTTNIGSIIGTSIDQFAQGNGPLPATARMSSPTIGETTDEPETYDHLETLQSILTGRRDSSALHSRCYNFIAQPGTVRPNADRGTAVDRGRRKGAP